MQNTINRDLADGKKISRPQNSQQPSSTGTMAAAAACLPQGTAFPQPPEGAFNLYGTDPRWNNDMINLKNWNEMMR
jgi:hypothetical protein